MDFPPYAIIFKVIMYGQFFFRLQIYFFFEEYILLI